MAALKNQLRTLWVLPFFFLPPEVMAADSAPLVRVFGPRVAEGRVSSQKHPATPLLEDGTPLLPTLLAPQDLPPLLPGLTGQRIQAYGHRPPDRYGRLPVQIVLPDAGGRWWQADIIGAGLARVWSNGPTDATLTALLSQEDEARHQRRGRWQEPDWQPVCAGQPEALRTGAFALIQGQVRRATLRQGTLWLDFGADWRTDTSATLPATVLKALPKGWRAAAFWPGQTVEIRGWVQGGPRLDLTGPGQIRLLPPGSQPCPENRQKN